MILRIDDTDIARNTQQSLDSIFDGLNWLELGWDEQYRQSERLDLHRQSEAIARKGDAYDDDWLRHTVDVIRSRFFTLKDFATRGRAYFADDFRNGELHFDYRLRPGVVGHSNALALMRAVGLEV